MKEIEIDVTEMACPMPLIRIKKAVKEMQPGDLLRVVGNDPIFEDTVRDFCEENTHEIVECAQDGRLVNLVLKIGKQ